MVNVSCLLIKLLFSGYLSLNYKQASVNDLETVLEIIITYNSRTVGFNAYEKAPSDRTM